MIQISIIGAGQLGSRHLQALASLKQQVSIQVVDPSADSLQLAKSRFGEVNANFTGKISYHASISELEKNLDVVIIATNSKMRRAVIEELLEHAAVKNLVLEKFLFVNAKDYSIVGKLLAEKKIKAWVNCPRRMMDFYRDLQKQISGNVHFSITGNAWGIGCNGIHLFDLFAFLTQSVNYTLTHDLLDEQLSESRRPGYIEFTGTVTAHGNGNSFRMTSFSEKPSGTIIHIDTPTARYSIEESDKAKVWISKMENNWQWEESSFVMPYQSQLTNVLVEEILETGNCKLTSYEESAALHLLILNNFLSFLRKIKNNNSIDECLIT